MGWILLFPAVSWPQNPLITDQFTADPTARVFQGKVFVYPSHDIPVEPGKGRPGWFCMADYHVFSSENLTDWNDHGVIVSQNTVPWADSAAYSMWAPDCVERNGKYFFYFPTPARVKEGRFGMGIGVAVADSPSGPFTPEPEPIKGVSGIDPNVFIDKDGQAYLYWAGRGMSVAKLKENMTELASERQEIQDLPKGMKEGPFLFERNGVYYFTYPHVENKIERLEYAVGDNPMGPFTFKGVIMDESPTGCWTNHHSVVEYKGQWFLFYHHNDLSPHFDKNRSIRADSLFFEPDGSIRKVIPTLRGVGLTPAGREIQIDRYTALDTSGAAIAFLDTSNRFLGWKTELNKTGAWVRYNSVDLGPAAPKSALVRAVSESGGTIEIRSFGPEKGLISRVEIPKSGEWILSRSALARKTSGIHNLCVSLIQGGPVSVDWIRFE
ncbi:MAG: family 43 glycosylhydrolase [bacterium]|nr:family 43 glycosylhydrolase [bacterium]